MQSFSQLSFGSTIISKLDHIGIIYLSGRHYFNVFRRYNSVYEIVIEDFNGDFYFHKDYKVRDSIRSIMCLSRGRMEQLETYSAFSIKHASSPLTELNDIPNMRWSEIQSRYYAISVDFGGIIDEPRQIAIQDTSSVETTPEVRSRSVPSAPIKAYRENPIALPEGTNLSDRFQKRTWSQLCGDQSEESEEELLCEEESEECDECSECSQCSQCSEEDSEYDSQYEWSSEEEEPDVLNLRNGKQVIRS
jgi:hypothetical protein